jgi:ribose 5-phosphate isomerase B
MIGKDVQVAIAADHAGFALKRHLAVWLDAQGHEVVDLGTDSEAPVDYPPFCAAAARAVVQGRAALGVVLGGSGQGEQIAANKVVGIRAALCHDEWMAELARRHNDANVLAMGARFVAVDRAQNILRTFLTTPFDGGRHEHRLELIAAIEREEREEREEA